MMIANSFQSVYSRVEHEVGDTFIMRLAKRNEPIDKRVEVLSKQTGEDSGGPVYIYTLKIMEEDWDGNV